MSRQVTIQPSDPKLRRYGVTADLVDVVTLAGGVGGWNELVRPRRRSATEWTNTPIRSQVIPLLLNGIEAAPGVDISIEPVIAALTALGAPIGPADQPPTVQLGGPLPAADGLWVVNDLAWGAPLRSNDGQRIQQQVTVTVLEYLAAQLVKSPAKKAKENHKHGKGK